MGIQATQAHVVGAFPLRKHLHMRILRAALNTLNPKPYTLTEHTQHNDKQKTQNPKKNARSARKGLVIINNLQYNKFCKKNFAAAGFLFFSVKKLL